jgi:hypothetical protein
MTVGKALFLVQGGRPSIRLRERWGNHEKEWMKKEKSTARETPINRERDLQPRRKKHAKRKWRPLSSTFSFLTSKWALSSSTPQHSSLISSSFFSPFVLQK